MSLILLRKDCEPILEEKGFGMLHIEVRNKSMVLVGQCGQVVTAINSIRFSSDTRFTAEERAYSKELFEKYIKEKEEVLGRYITAQSAFKLVDVPAVSTELISSVNFAMDPSSPGKTRLQYIRTRAGFNIYYGPGEKISQLAAQNGNSSDLDIIEDLLPILPELLSQAKKLQASKSEYTIAAEKVNDIRAELTPVCSF